MKIAQANFACLFKPVPNIGLSKVYINYILVRLSFTKCSVNKLIQYYISYRAKSLSTLEINEIGNLKRLTKSKLKDCIL